MSWDNIWSSSPTESTKGSVAVGAEQCLSCAGNAPVRVVFWSFVFYITGTDGEERLPMKGSQSLRYGDNQTLRAKNCDCTHVSSE